MDARSHIAAEERFFSAASRCGYHTRAITILQGDDGDLFAVCEKDLKEPLEDVRRWVGRGNDTLRELVSALLCGAMPYNLNVTLTVPFRPLRASEEDHLG